jgi:DHA1 family multidrug resistance protein-like MFS transporter
MGEGALRFLLPVHIRALGQPYTVVGTLTAVFGMATLLSRFPTGLAYRADRARRLLVVAGAACSAAFLLLPLTGSLPLVGLLVALDGIGWGVVTTVLLSLMLANRQPRTSPAAAMGWYVGVNGLGHAAAALLGGTLADRLGVTTTFLVLGVVPVVATVLMATVLASRIGAPAPSGRPATGVDGGIGAARTAVLRRALLLPATVWTAAFVSFYANTMNSVLISFFPLLALLLGMSLTEAGTLSAVRSGVSALARFGSIPVLERVPERRLRTPTMVATAVTTAAVSLTPMVALQTPIWALNGAFRGFLRVSSSAGAMESVSDADSGPTAGLLSAGLDLGKIVGPIAAGAVADAIGIDGMFRVLPFALLGVFLLLGAAERAGTRRAAARSA